MDFGYHSDIVELVFKRHGYTDDATRQAQFYNGLTDLLGNVISAIASPSCEKALKDYYPDLYELYNNLKPTTKLHADNLFKPGDAKQFLMQLMNNVASYAKRLEEQFKEQVDTTKQQELVTQFLRMLGVASHTLQDFCSHSTWVAQFPPADRNRENTVTKYRAFQPLDGAKRTELEKAQSGWYEYFTQWNEWYTVKDAIFEGMVLHDGVDEDLEKKLREIVQPLAEDKLTILRTATSVQLDYQSRQYTYEGDSKRLTTWDEGYVAGYLLCDAFLEFVKDHAPELTQSLEDYQLPGSQQAALIRSLYKMKYTFMWFQYGHHDGHYKGPGSGHLSLLISAALLEVVKPGNVLALWAFNRSILGVIALASYLNALNEQLNAFIETLNELSTRLYIQTEKPIDRNQSQTIKRLRIFSLQVHDFVTSQRKLNEEQFAPPGPDPFIRVTIEWTEDNKPFTMVYNERAFQNIPGQVAGDNWNYQMVETSPQMKAAPPWHVVHPVVGDTDTLKIHLQVFDEDALLNGADDEYKITPREIPMNGVHFTVNLTNKTTTLQPLGSLNSEDKATRFTLIGAPYTFWFPPSCATIVLSMVVADAVIT